MRLPETQDAETTVRIHYENGRLGLRSRRLALAGLPESVRRELETTTSVLQPWAFLWSRDAA